jgi:hypothetical protein
MKQYCSEYARLKANTKEKKINALRQVLFTLKQKIHNIPKHIMLPSSEKNSESK